MLPSLSSQVPYYAFVNVYIYHPPFVCHHAKKKERKENIVPPSLKRDFENAYLLLFASHSIQRLDRPLK